MPEDNIFQPSFWDDEEQELWDDIAAPMLEIYFQGVDGGVAALPPDVRVLTDFDLVNTSALDWATRYRYELIKGITDTTRKQVQVAISDWIQSGAPLDALETVLEKTFGSARARMISVTEVTRAFAEGNAAAWTSTGMVTKVRWNTARDDRVCKICQPRNGQVYDIGDIGNRPPVHIGDRCWMSPVVSEEALERRLTEILA